MSENVCPSPADPSEDKDTPIKWACRTAGCQFRPTEWHLDYAFGSPHDVRNFERAWRTLGEVLTVWGGGRLTGRPKTYMRYAYPKGKKQRSYLAEAKEAQVPRNCGAEGFCLDGGVIDAGEIYLLVGDFAGVPVKNQHRRPNRESYHPHCAEFMGYGHAARHLNPKI